jgi:hypothetical protein
MRKENQYVNFFYRKYSGRVAIGVGYGNDLSEIFPFVFHNIIGEALGIVALGVIHDIEYYVYIYHLSAFLCKQGHGSTILNELCHQADQFNINLSVSPIFIDNGKDPNMESDKLIQWYQDYGFRGNSGLVRLPINAQGD